jgi:phage terminase small subunit
MTMATKKPAPAPKRAAAKKVPKKPSKVSAKPAQRVTKAGSSQGSAAARRRIFADAYITNGGNATQAAIACGLSPASAGSTGQRMAKHAEVVAMIAEKQAALAQKYELTAESVIKSLAQAVYFDPRKLYEADGSLKPVHLLDDDTAMGLTGLEVVEMAGGAAIGGPEGVKHHAMYTKKVKWVDKNTAREQAMKHLGLLKDRTEITGPNGGPLQLVMEQIAANPRSRLSIK